MKRRPKYFGEAVARAVGIVLAAALLLFFILIYFY